MKQFVTPIILGLLLLVGCNEADGMLTETAVVQLPTAVPTAQLPTATFTALPSAIIPTTQLSTSTPENMPYPSSTSTPTQVSTVTPESMGTTVVPDMLPEGYLLFLGYRNTR